MNVIRKFIIIDIIYLYSYFILIRIGAHLHKLYPKLEFQILVKLINIDQSTHKILRNILNCVPIDINKSLQ